MTLTRLNELSSEPPSFVKNNPFTDILAKRGKEPLNTYQKPSEIPQKKAKHLNNDTETPTPTPLPYSIGQLTTRKSIILSNKRLLKALLTKKIPVQVANAASFIYRNQLAAVCPPRPVEITQQVAVNTEPKQLLSKLNEDEQAVLSRAIAKLEAAPSPP